MTDIALPSAPGQIASVSDVVDRMERAAASGETSVEDVVAALGAASFLPVLMAPALAVVSPLSGVPVFSSICGLTIALVALQLLLHRKHLWLPRWLMRRRISSRSLRTAVRWLRGPAQFLDRNSRARMSFLVRPPFSWITEAACMLCGLAMPFLELFPLTSSILGAAVTLFSLSLLVRDGLISALAFGFIGLAGYVGWVFVT